MRSYKIITTMLLLPLVSACLKGPGLFKQDDSQQASQSLIDLFDEDGVLSGKYDPTLGITQTLSAGASSGIEGAAVIFPPGALAIGTTITLQESDDVATSLAASDLGLAALAPGGGAVAVSSSTATDASSPFTIQLPFSGSTSLRLLSAPKMLVVYQAQKVREGISTLGVIPAEQVTIVGSFVQIRTSHFGVYQVAFTSDAAVFSKEVVATRQVATKAAIKKLPEIRWTFSDAKFNTTTQTGQIKVDLTGMATLKRCSIMQYLDPTTVPSRVLYYDNPDDGDDGPYDYEPIKSEAHTIYFRFECLDVEGRFARSPMTDALAIPANTFGSSSGGTAVVDTVAPTLSFVAMDRSLLDVGVDAQPTLTLSLSEAASVTLFSDDACTAAISSAQNLQSGAGQTITTSGIAPASKVRIYGKAVDAAGLASACTSLVTYSHLLKFADPFAAGSNGFGYQVVELANGNVVITSPNATVNGVANAGAVHLFNGQTGVRIRTLHGSMAGDLVGNGGVVILSTGHFVVVSPNWNANLGAVTWVDAANGVDEAVSGSNSLVGSAGGDNVGGGGVVTLTNGNYVVSSPSWTNGGIANAGAVTWGNGVIGTVGAVSSLNSLVGSTADDMVGQNGVVALTNDNYVVVSTSWDCQLALGCTGPIANVGAVTWGNGAGGTAGAVNFGNSLVGSMASDMVGSGGVTALKLNGNYVVSSPMWRNGSFLAAGAVTWGDGDGTPLLAGYVTTSNSLVGSYTNDKVGFGGVVALSNGHYVVRSQYWDNGGTADAGAVTWRDGTAAISGPVAVSTGNSLVGSSTNDWVGSGGVVALNNGNYVVRSPLWDDGGTIDAGAVTWRQGASAGVSEAVSASNSLVGADDYDSIGSHGVTALTNDNYVVASASWGLNDLGAVTWVDGATGLLTGSLPTGYVTGSNSLTGGTSNDKVGFNGVVALSNGNYVVRSSLWDNTSPSAVDAGAVTWGDGATGATTGDVTATNSIVGSSPDDMVGGGGPDGVVALMGTGHYVVASPSWDNGGITDTGAVTWGNGADGSVFGPISASNSLIGSSIDDTVGSAGVTALTNGHYVVRSTIWDNGATIDTGAVTWGNGAGGTVGSLNTANSIVGANGSEYIGDLIPVPTADGSLIFSSTYSYTTQLPIVVKMPGSEGVFGTMP